MDLICVDKDGNELEYLTQWDLNQTIYVPADEFQAPPDFHFFNTRMKEALVVASEIDDGILKCKVPNLILQEPYPVYVFIYDSKDDSAKSVAEFKINVHRRVRPSEYTYVENIDRVSTTSIRNEFNDKLKTLSDTFSDRTDELENPHFSDYTGDDNISSGEKVQTIFSKIKKFISDFKTHISSGNPHSDSAPKNHNHSVDNIISGILPLARGGTGVTSISELSENLGVPSKADSGHKHSADDIISGILPISRGGTGASTAAQALKNLGITVAATVVNLLNGLNENIVDALAKKADASHNHSASNITSGTFSANQIPNLEISKINGLHNSLNAKQNNLGFTPIQQGGGTDQSNNKIYIGWTGSKLKAQVDATDMGDIVTTGSANNTKLPMSKVEGLDTELDERQAGSLLAAAELIGQYRGDSIRLSSGESGEIEFPKNSAGLACVGETSSTGASGLWYFASSKNGVAVSTIINSSSITVAGAIDGNNAVLTFTNTGSPHTVGAILLYKD